jgi:hypothetical protein
VRLTAKDPVRTACGLGFARPEDREAYVSAFMVLLDSGVEVVADGSEHNGRAQRGRDPDRVLSSSVSVLTEACPALRRHYGRLATAATSASWTTGISTDNGI